MSNTISLKGEFTRKEAPAGAAITPGHLIVFSGATNVIVHASAAGVARVAFALENDLVGGAIGDAYDTGDTVQYGVFSPGAEIYALLAHGENISKGDALASAGDGTLQAHTGDASHSVVAFAMEALNNTTGAAARITVEAA